jgi:hypothetical protein
MMTYRAFRLFLFVISVGLALPRVVSAQSGTAATSILVIQGDSLRQKGEVNRAIETFRRAIATDSGSALPRFHLAYALLAAGHTPEAIGAFHEGLKRDSTFRDGFRQLGYLYSAEAKDDSAFSSFVLAQRVGQLTARDWLEVGYVQARRGNSAAARDAFAAALADGDSTVRALATRAISDPAITAATPALRARRSMYVEMYAAPLYQTRFSNAIGQGFVRLGLQPVSAKAITPYLSLRLTRDSKSVGGPQPSIFSDNSLVPAAGIKRQAFTAGPTLYAELGPAFILLDDGKGSRIRSDVRVGGYYSKGWYQPHDFRTELYVDASYYSRFDRNVITYLQMREIMTAVQSRAGSVELFARLGGVGDTRRVSYNNAIELAPGVAVVPGPTRRVVISLEYVAGRYLIDAFSGSRASYTDVRAMVVFYAVALPGRARS